MLKQRVLTAIVVAAGFLSVLFYASSTVFALVIGAILSLAAWEWARLASVRSFLGRLAYIVVIVAVGFGLRGIDRFGVVPLAGESIFLAACLWWAIVLLWVQGYPSSALLWGSRGVRLCMGIMVLVPTLLAFLYLRALDSGAWYIFAVVLLVACADIGAYFAGRAFGKRKLAPKVSPGKSWEGVAGGLVAVVIVATVFSWATGRSDWLTTLAIAIATGLVSVLGDLLESMVKRHRGVKDSGHLLPGHGGVLDRIDGLTAAAPVFAFAILMSGWQL